MGLIPTIAEAARAFAARTLSPVELTRACLARVERFNATLHAVLVLDPEGALRAARAAEARWMRGEAKGPLDGIPIAHKDIVDVAGVPTTACSRVLAGAPPAPADSPIAARWRGAGAVCLGKLTTHEFAWGGPSFDLPTPPARNPWNPAHFTAGSSSGTAAAIASGMILGGTGSDTGGSIRGPAALCGLAGIKPSYGLVPRTGVIPLAWSLDHLGPLARTAEDCAILLSACAGHDPSDPASDPRPAPDLLGGLGEGVRGLRIGVPEAWHEGVLPLTQATREAIDRAAKIFQDQCAVIRAIDLPCLQDLTDAGMVILLAEAFAIHAPWLRTRRQDYGEILRERLSLGALLSAEDYLAAQRRRRTLAAAIAEAMRDVDLILTAAAVGEAPPIEAVDRWSGFKLPNLLLPFNLTGQPAISVAAGLGAGGLPVAIQLAGRPGEDALVLRAAHAYEIARGPVPLPPLLAG